MRKIFSLVILIVLLLSFSITVYADTNQDTDYSDSSKEVTNASIVAGSFGTYKVSLYYSIKSTDNPVTTNFSNYKMWGVPFLITNGVQGSAVNKNSYYNWQTNKVYHLENQNEAPNYSYTINTNNVNNMYHMGLPDWKAGNNLNSWPVRTFFGDLQTNGEEDINVPNLTYFIRIAAEEKWKLSGSNYKNIEAIERLLELNKSWYGSIMDYDGLPVNELKRTNIMPASENCVVSWLVVMEPAFHFIPADNGGMSFIMTPTEGNLANRAAGPNYIIKNHFSLYKYGARNVKYDIFPFLLENGAGFQVEVPWFNGKFVPKPSGSLAFTGYQNTTPEDVVKYGGYSLYHRTPVKLNQITIQAKTADKGIDLPLIVEEIFVTAESRDKLTEIELGQFLPLGGIASVDTNSAKIENGSADNLEPHILSQFVKSSSGSFQSYYDYSQTGYGDYFFHVSLIYKDSIDNQFKVSTSYPIDSPKAKEKMYGTTGAFTNVSAVKPLSSVICVIDIPVITVRVVDENNRQIGGATIKEISNWGIDDRTSLRDDKLFYFTEKHSKNWGDYSFKAIYNGKESDVVTVNLNENNSCEEITLKLKDSSIVGATGDITIKENELIKGGTVNISPTGSVFTHNCTLSNCPGGSYVNGVWVDCEHSKTLSNATSITEETVSVLSSYYWNKSKLGQTNVDRLKILRTLSGDIIDNGTNYRFDSISDYSSDTVDNVFEFLESKSLVTHRSGAFSENEIIRTAAFMSNTSKNKSFNNFIKDYYTNYPSAYNNQNGNFNSGGFNVEVNVGDITGADGTANVSYCSGGSDTEDITGDISKSTISSSVIVEGTYNASSKNSPIQSLEAKIENIGQPGSRYNTKLPSKTINFVPAFQMDYSKKYNDINPTNKVWMLAKGLRTFNAMDYMRIDLVKPVVEVSAAWSRDAEDRVLENGRLSNRRVIKSAQNFTKVSGSGSQVQIDLYYHAQDPAFAENKTLAQSNLNNIDKEYVDAVNEIYEYIKNGGASFYSNLWDSTTGDTLHKVTKPNWADLSLDQTVLKNNKNYNVTLDDNGVESFYLDNDNKQDYDVKSANGHRTININGTTVNLNTNNLSSLTADIYNNSNNILSSLLETNKSVNSSNKWYNESYEGIVLVHRRFTITLDNMETDPVMVHPQHSDWLTETNETSSDLTFISTNTKLIKDDFGIGVEIRLPSTIINGNNIPGSVVIAAPFRFDIRGSNYDN